jgi:hypothetical protein
LNEHRNNGEDASRIVEEMGKIGDKLKEIDEYGE